MTPKDADKKYWTLEMFYAELQGLRCARDLMCEGCKGGTEGDNITLDGVPSHLKVGATRITPCTAVPIREEIARRREGK